MTEVRYAPIEVPGSRRWVNFEFPNEACARYVVKVIEVNRQMFRVPAFTQGQIEAMIEGWVDIL